MPVANSIDWEKRIQRAAELAERNPSAREVLAFYGHILDFQSKLSVPASRPSLPVPGDGTPFREQIDVDTAVRYLPTLLSLVQQKGPPKLALLAAETGRVSLEEQRDLFQSYLLFGDNNHQESISFFARVLFQPYAEALVATLNVPSSDSSASVCPVCEGRPQLAVLRPEGDGGKRYLVCSFCGTEWEFRRVLCPHCGEVDHQKLPRYSSEDFIALRVEACDTCKHYLKSVDMTIDGLAVAIVDEVASAPLDVWAIEHGYRKICTNLMGF
ncbi:MAG: formate dehydrogenase accessory protein FdhE [Candidatus Korobacteraceae bacterium]